MSAAEVHHEVCVVYSQNVMSEGTARQWCWMFKDGRTNVVFTMKSEVVGWPSVVSDDFVQNEIRHSQFQNFLMNFRKFHALSSTKLSQLG
jgi:hypothetical protein